MLPIKHIKFNGVEYTQYVVGSLDYSGGVRENKIAVLTPSIAMHTANGRQAFLGYDNTTTQEIEITLFKENGSLQDSDMQTLYTALLGQDGFKRLEFGTGVDSTTGNMEMYQDGYGYGCVFKEADAMYVGGACAAIRFSGILDSNIAYKEVTTTLKMNTTTTEKRIQLQGISTSPVGVGVIYPTITFPQGFSTTTPKSIKMAGYYRVGTSTMYISTSSTAFTPVPISSSATVVMDGETHMITSMNRPMGGFNVSGYNPGFIYVTPGTDAYIGMSYVTTAGTPTTGTAINIGIKYKTYRYIGW